MNNREKHKLKRQIIMQAENVETQSDAELAVSVTTTCDALLKSILPTNFAVSETAESNRMHADLLAIAGKVLQLLGETNTDTVSTKGDSTILAQLQAATERQKQLETDKRNLGKQFEEVERFNQELEAEIHSYKEKLEEAERHSAALQSMSKECSPERLDAKRAGNAALLETIHIRQAELKMLEADKEDLEDQLRELGDEIAKIKGLIDAIPEENVRLKNEYYSLKKTLSELEFARENFSPEKQAVLSKKIEELTPVVERLAVTHEDLGKRLADLDAMRTEYDAKNLTLTTNIIEIVTKALAGLDKQVSEQEFVLKDAKRTADGLADKIAECDRLKQEYKDWLQTDSTPLEEMSKVLGRAEFIQLKQTLDLSQIDSIKTLREEIESRLRQLDDILEKCVKAVKIDKKTLERRVLR